jgi:hypothetical protein
MSEPTPVDVTFNSLIISGCVVSGEKCDITLTIRRERYGPKKNRIYYTLTCDKPCTLGDIHPFMFVDENRYDMYKGGNYRNTTGEVVVSNFITIAVLDEIMASDEVYQKFKDDGKFVDDLTPETALIKAFSDLILETPETAIIKACADLIPETPATAVIKAFVDRNDPSAIETGMRPEQVYFDTEIKPFVSESSFLRQKDHMDSFVIHRAGLIAHLSDMWD